MSLRVNRHGIPILDAGHRPKRHLDPFTFNFDVNENVAMMTLRQYGTYLKIRRDTRQQEGHLNEQHYS